MTWYGEGLEMVWSWGSRRAWKQERRGGDVSVGYHSMRCGALLRFCVEHSRGQRGPRRRTDDGPWLTRLQASTNTGCYETRVQQGKGENQRSNVFSGMSKTGRLLVSDLIKTLRILAIQEMSKPGQWVESDDDINTAVAQVPPSTPTCGPHLSPWYPLKPIHAHFANCCDILAIHFVPFLSQHACGRQVTGLNGICIWNQRGWERDSCDMKTTSGL